MNIEVFNEKVQQYYELYEKYVEEVKEIKKMYHVLDSSIKEGYKESYFPWIFNHSYEVSLQELFDYYLGNINETNDDDEEFKIMYLEEIYIQPLFEKIEDMASENGIVLDISQHNNNLIIELRPDMNIPGTTDAYLVAKGEYNSRWTSDFEEDIQYRYSNSIVEPKEKTHKEIIKIGHKVDENYSFFNNNFYHVGKALRNGNKFLQGAIKLDKVLSEIENDIINDFKKTTNF